MLTPMKQIEADVVFVATNRVTGEIYIAPYWECSIVGDRMYQSAQAFGLACVESSGAGEVRVQIYDYRKQSLIDELGTELENSRTYLID